MALSCGGESPNISSRDVDVLNDVLAPDVLNRKGGALLSGVGRVIPSWKDWALLFARLGRRNGGRRLLQRILLAELEQMAHGLSYSAAAVGASIGDASRGLGAADVMGESIGVPSGDGECTSSSVVMKAGLCGSGDISMTSIDGAGEDDGNGGVVITSSVQRLSMAPLSYFSAKALTISIGLAQKV